MRSKPTQAGRIRLFAFLLDFALVFFRFFREFLFHIGGFVHGLPALLQALPGKFFRIFNFLPGRIFRLRCRILLLSLATTEDQDGTDNCGENLKGLHGAFSVIGASRAGINACAIC